MAEVSASPLFFALAAPAEVRALAGRFQDVVRMTSSQARFPDPDGLHLTLAYLGRMAPDQVPALLALAAEAARPCPGFTLRTAAVGGFPRPGRTRILWLGFEPQPALEVLAGRLRAALRSGRVGFDEKPFLAHLTLARFREPVDLGGTAFPVLEPCAFAVRGIGLFRSLPGPHGSQYQLLGEAELG